MVVYVKAGYSNSVFGSNLIENNISIARYSLSSGPRSILWTNSEALILVPVKEVPTHELCRQESREVKEMRMSSFFPNHFHDVGRTRLAHHSSTAGYPAMYVVFISYDAHC